MNTFNFSDEEFLSVVNMICKKETPGIAEYVPITSMDTDIHLDRLDSLGMIIFFVWLGEMFEIPEETLNAFVTTEVFTITALKEFVRVNHTQTSSYDEMKELAVKCF